VYFPKLHVRIKFIYYLYIFAITFQLPEFFISHPFTKTATPNLCQFHFIAHPWQYLALCSIAVSGKLLVNNDAANHLNIGNVGWRFCLRWSVSIYIYIYYSICFINMFKNGSWIYSPVGWDFIILIIHTIFYLISNATMVSLCANLLIYTISTSTSLIKSLPKSTKHENIWPLFLSYV
jgi:hypothetical protein